MEKRKNPTARSSWPRGIFVNGLMLFWAISLSILVSSLMAGHWVSLPRPKTGTVLKMPADTANALGQEMKSEFVAFHFLYGDCPCSRKVFQHLIERETIGQIPELIVMIDCETGDQTAALKSGFKFISISPKQLKAQFDIESAPMLVVTDGTDQIRYSGGYTSRKQALNYIDEAVICDLLAGKEVVENPVFGCGVSTRLKDIVDPFRLKTL